MNVEIDISDPRKLTRIKTELTRLLNIVDFALAQHAANQPTSSGPLLPLQHQNGDPTPLQKAESEILEIIDSLPKRFTTTDVMLAMGDRGKERRNTIKLVLKEAARVGVVRLARTGKGRRPNEYEKD